MKKTSVLTAALFSAAFSLFGFDWPQKEIAADSFSTYFGQSRGGLLSPSLVFTGSGEIKACEDGIAAVVFTEHDEEPGIFESTLGNAVVLSHKDNLMTVYANISGEYTENLESLSEVKAGTFLGKCGISGWQEKNALLEFQVVDSGAKSFVNPRILMPRFGEEHALAVPAVRAVNKKGESVSLGVKESIPRGTYLLYRESRGSHMIYKSTLLINGAIVDSITYDTLVEVQGRLCTAGAKNYDSKTVYPDENHHLLGEITIPRGRNKITVILADLNGKEKSVTYSVDAY